MAEQELIETRAGLPNTCSQCGKEPGDSWFATSDDAARSGAGVCSSCAGRKQELPPRPPANEIPGHVLQRAQELIEDVRVLRPESAARAEPEAQADIRRAGVAAEDRQTRDALGKKR